MTYSVALLCYPPYITNQGGHDMEAVTLAGIAVVAVGGYYSVLDLLADLGIRIRITQPETKKSTYSCTYIFTPQRRIKKVSGVNI